MRRQPFSDPDDGPDYTITPLGAAVVEAMPDQKKVRAIQATFKRTGHCPASALFTQAEADAWSAKARRA